MNQQISQKTLIIGGFIFILLLILISIPSLYFYSQYKKTQELLFNPSLAAREEVKTLKTAVSKLMIIPDEDPIIVTVTDKERLKDQPFFAQAKNGDKVLIFQNARKAILFDPVSNKIIEVGPLVGGTPQPTPGNYQLNENITSQPTNIQITQIPKTQSLNIAIYNGTDKENLTTPLEKELKKKIPGVNVVYKEYAKIKTYDKTIIYDLIGTNERDISNLAKIANAQIVTDLPEGEELPPQKDPDPPQILIIIGNDRK